MPAPLSVDIQQAWNRFLQELELAKNYPDFEYFGKRSAMRECNEPGIAFAREFRFGIKCNDRVTMEISFTRKTHNGGE